MKEAFPPASGKLMIIFGLLETILFIIDRKIYLLDDFFGYLEFLGDIIYWMTVGL